MACCDCPSKARYVVYKCDHCDNDRELLTCITVSYGGSEPILILTAPSYPVVGTNLCGYASIVLRTCIVSQTAPDDDDGVVFLWWEVRANCDYVDFTLSVFTGPDDENLTVYTSRGGSPTHSPWGLRWHETPQTVGPWTITSGCTGENPEPVNTVCCLFAEEVFDYPPIPGESGNVIDPDCGYFSQPAVPIAATPEEAAEAVDPCVNDTYGTYLPNEWCGSLGMASACRPPWIIESLVLVWIISPDHEHLSVWLHDTDVSEGACYHPENNPDIPPYTTAAPPCALYHAIIPAASLLTGFSLDATALAATVFVDGYPDHISFTPCGVGSGGGGGGDVETVCWSHAEQYDELLTILIGNYPGFETLDSYCGASGDAQFTALAEELCNYWNLFNIGGYCYGSEANAWLIDKYPGLW